MVSVIGNTTRLPPLPMRTICLVPKFTSVHRSVMHSRLPQSAGADEVEERRIVVAHGVIECRRFIVLQLAHPLHRLRQQ